MPKSRVKKLINKRISKKGEFPLVRFIASRNRYEVDAGFKLGGGKKHRKWFKTTLEAKAYAEQIHIRLKNLGLSGFTLSKEQQVDAEQALKITKEFGVSLVEAVTFYANFHKLKGAEMTFEDLVNDFRSQLDKDRAAGEGVADATYRDYMSRHKRLKKEFLGVKLITFSFNEHWENLRVKLGTSSRRYENHLRILFNHAVKKEFLKVSPMKGSLKKMSNPEKPKILTENQWRQLLLTAIETDKELDLLSYVVLILFMGLRPDSEVKRIDWKNINFRKAKLFIGDEDTGKSDLGRTLEIPKAALDLLHLCKRKKGKIVPVSYKHRKNWDILRQRAGFIVKDDSGLIIRNDWVPDIARHTAGSMVYAKTQSREAVRTFLGHTNNVTMGYYVNHGDSMDEEAQRFYSFQAPTETNQMTLKTA